MTALNKVIIIGRLTREPEQTATNTGTAIVKFGVAVDSGFGDNKKTAFVDVTTWGKTAEFARNYFSKGKEILIEGRLDFDQWESAEGQKRSKLYITADHIGFVGSKADQGGQSDRGDQGALPPSEPIIQEPSDDSDIPF